MSKAADTKLQAAYSLLSDAVDDVRGDGLATRATIRAAQEVLSVAISLNRPAEGFGKDDET